MALFKTTYFIQQGNAGWSESFYRNADTMGAQESATLNLIGSRVALLASTGKCVGYRITVVDAALPSKVVSREFVTTSGLDADSPYQSAVVQMFCLQNLRRILLIRGIPDIVLAGGSWSPSSAYSLAMRAFLSNLRDSLWGIVGIDRSNLLQEVVSVSNTGLLTTGNPHGILKGQRLRFRRARDVNRKPVTTLFAAADVPTLDTIQLAPYSYAAIDAGAKFRRITKGFVAFNGFTDVLKIRSRKVGRPFDLFRGRRLAAH